MLLALVLSVLEQTGQCCGQCVELVLELALAIAQVALLMIPGDGLAHGGYLMQWAGLGENPTRFMNLAEAILRGAIGRLFGL